MAKQASVNKSQMSRKEVDDFIAARLAEQRAARKPPQQVADPNSNGLMNLMNILLGRSPVQETPWSQDLR